MFSFLGNGNRTEWSPVRSVIIRVITKSDDRAAGVRFVYHEYDYRPNWTPLSPSTNENHFVNFTGATFALETYVFTLACIRSVYINKFVARHENLSHRKYSLEKKTSNE